MIEQALQHYRKNKEVYLNDLKELVKIPSVSFPGFDPKEVDRSAEAVKRLLVKRGLQNVQIIKMGNAHPYVYGEWLKAPGKPTLLLYAHHDVQPPGKAENWKTKPFEPTVVGERLFGRGAADDKAGVVCHTAAIAAYLESAKDLPLNIKIIIEGEEEIGSEHLEKFLQSHKELLQADVMVLTDTANFDVGLPALTVALRGLVSVEVEVRALEHSVHSGMWGGPIPDPALALCKMLGTLADDEGRPALKDIDKDARSLSADEKKALEALPYDEREFRKQASLLDGVPMNGGKGTVYEKMWFQPSVSVNAFEASSRLQAGNIINASAWAKVGIRIVPNMNPERVLEQFTRHLKSVCPWGLQVEIKPEACGGWWFTKPEGPAFDAARRALEFGYGVKPVMMGAGGSIPFVQPFSDALGGAPALLIGVEDPYTNAHSENESLHIPDWEKAILSAIKLYDELAKAIIPKARR